MKLEYQLQEGDPNHSKTIPPSISICELVFFFAMHSMVTPARRDQASALLFCDVEAGYLRRAKGRLVLVASECRKRYLKSQF